MTVSAQDTVFQHVGNGVSVTFAYGCQVQRADDLSVYVADVLTVAGFTINGIGSQSGGSVTFTAAPASGVQIRLERIIVLERDTDYQQNGDFLARVVNPDFDRLWMAMQQHKSDITRAIKIPASDSGVTTILPAAAVRANSILGFDYLGNPAVMIPAEQSASALQFLLATFAGAGITGFSWTQAYAAGTLGYAMKTVPNIRQFPGFTGDGVADDAAAWQLAADSGELVIDARGVTSAILSQVNLASNQTILLIGASITTAGTALKTFSAVTKNNFNLVGPFKITGDLVSNPGTGVTSCGIYIEDCAKWRVDDPTILNVKGYGIRLEPGAGTASRGDHGEVTNPRIDGCVWGWHDTAGSGAEYCTILNMHVTGCAEAGIESAAGNMNWIGGQCVDNLKDGFRLFGGSNNAHGIVTGMNINHNPQYNLYAENVTNGMTYNGCHFYANGATGAGASYFKNCKGIVLDGGVFDGWLYNDSGANSGLNYMLNMYCPGDYGDVQLLSTNGATGQLVALRNYGAGSYTAGVPINTPSSVWLAASRAAGSLQTLTSGAATTLNFTTTDADRRATFSATSIFTAPEAGWYRLRGNQFFSGTTLNAAASFIELQKNAAAYDAQFPAALNGAGTLNFCYTVDSIYLAVGDTLQLVATITGTGTITHGTPTWRCSMSVERTA